MNLFNGAGDRNRTYDLRVTSALLYRLSYTGTGAGVLFNVARRGSSGFYQPGGLNPLLVDQFDTVFVDQDAALLV